MKHVFRDYRLLRPWGLCMMGVLGLVQPPVFAQVLAQNNPPPSVVRQADRYRLTELIQQLKDRYRVNILFEERALRNLHVLASAIQPKTSLEASLSALLQPLGLRYRKVKNNYVILTNEADKKRQSATPDPEPATDSPLMNESMIATPPANGQPVPVELTRVADVNVSGRVTEENGGSLPGVSITLKGTNRGTTTDENGTYSLNIPDGGGTLIYSFVGYRPQEANVSNQTVINITLSPNDQTLSEVVVIGYGSARKKDLTGAVSAISERDFNKGTFTSPDQLIQGKASGVQIINNSGQPGGATTVKIRGNAAITGTGQPLYVVDGVPLSGGSARPGTGGGFGTSPAGNPLNFLNPADIASIDVLKDASSTAIYGSRAAYGVIIINTKKGQSGQPKLDFSLSAGASSILRRIKLLEASDYREAIKYYGVNASNDRGGNSDGLGSVLRTGLQQNYNLAISGGGEQGKYRLSLGYLDQDGIINKTGFKKYSSNFSANLKFLRSKRLGVDINILSSQYSETIAPITNDAGSGAGLMTNALQWNPTDSLRKADGSLNIRQGISNPLATSELYDDESKVTTVLGSISPYFKFTDWLEYRLVASVNYGTGIRRASINQLFDPLTRIGSATVSNNEAITSQFTNTLTINREIHPALNLNALIGYEYMKFTNSGTYNGVNGPASGFGNYGLDYTNYLQYSNTSGRIVSSFVSPLTELQSYFTRAVVNYADKYLLTATFRVDGSTKFGANHKYGYFPSVSAAWNISSEPFFKVSFINALKLRAGWGKTGNQEFPAGASQARYSFLSNGGLGLTNNPNPDLKWQTDKQVNIGFDYSVLANKISGSVDYFHKTTTDLLFPSFPIQPSAPGSAITWINLDGSILNRGLEASVNATLMDRKSFSWDLTVNATFLSNAVSGLSAPIFTGVLGGQGLTGAIVEVIENGHPVNTFYTRKFLGLDKDTGLSLYEDAGNSFYHVGNPNPNTLLGLSTTIRYNKLSLTANLNGTLGNSIYNNTRNNIIAVNSIVAGRNIAESVFRSAVKESTSNPVTPSSRFIENGSYLKMANTTLTYNIGTVGRVFRGLNVYVTGQNLFVLTKYTGFDPEINVDKSVNSVPSLGIDYVGFPSTRSILFGLNVSL